MSHAQQEQTGRNEAPSPILYSHNNPTIPFIQSTFSNSIINADFNVNDHISDAHHHNSSTFLKLPPNISTWEASNQENSTLVNSKLNLYDPELISLGIHYNSKQKTTLLSPPTSACSEFRNTFLKYSENLPEGNSFSKKMSLNDILYRAIVVCQDLAKAYSFMDDNSSSQIISSLPDHTSHQCSSKDIFDCNMEALINYLIEPLKKEFFHHPGLEICEDPSAMYKGKGKKLPLNESEELHSSPYTFNETISTKENNEISKEIFVKSETSTDFLDTETGLESKSSSWMSLTSLKSSQEINNYYHQCFRSILQITCKIIAKHWIKAIEPRKQTNFPYKGRNKTQPKWWPSEVEHREPDHLKIDERIKLLISIVRNPNIDINKLKSSTSGWQRHNKGDTKLKYLDAVYNLAELERKSPGKIPSPDNAIKVKSIIPFQRTRKITRQKQQLKSENLSIFRQETERLHDIDLSKSSKKDGITSISDVYDANKYKDQGLDITPSNTNDESSFVYGNIQGKDILELSNIPRKVPNLGSFYEKTDLPLAIMPQIGIFRKTSLPEVTDFKPGKQNHQRFDRIEGSSSFYNEECHRSSFNEMGYEAFKISRDDPDAIVNSIWSPESVLSERAFTDGATIVVDDISEKSSDRYSDYTDRSPYHTTNNIQ
ncbi:hypothetical protein NADFUDRAFT_41284 [Nadsonia fulvescens var. elongata DSM 6958]|uniref:Subtelomeric hrmA-associated cluster protein AFUB-079030/YDR124W-like helical bundle domain-containing protein n=1 Tax=Nadsonia fulvescens var. elongata DSM 6958 TaxID=857566 RepID=A0A1E3PP78_9ASCO|nr:hypothetical protein NADFUDRAFT_41284 [Nadsonia fulvescens var. elongata DSM 6958]